MKLYSSDNHYTTALQLRYQESFYNFFSRSFHAYVEENNRKTIRVIVGARSK